MSWSINWPMNVVPAVCVSLFGLFTLRAGSTISATGPADKSSLASRMPPGLPISSKAASSSGLDSAKRRELREDATETVFADNVPALALLGCVSSTDCESVRHAQSHNTCADGFEKLPSTDSTGWIVILGIHAVSFFLSHKATLRIRATTNFCLSSVT